MSYTYYYKFKYLDLTTNFRMLMNAFLILILIMNNFVLSVKFQWVLYKTENIKRNIKLNPAEMVSKDKIITTMINKKVKLKYNFF